jgi:hypothetical protein
MRYLLPFVAVLLCSVTLSAQDYSGQEQDSTESIFNEETIQGLALLKTIMNDCPAYELYRTDNMWTFLKLETSTGKIWQVQYAVGDGDAFQVVLNDISLAFDGMETAGRFKLHPTDNIYNFLLLDTHTGSVWQAQWSQNPDNRGVIPIYEL